MRGRKKVISAFQWVSPCLVKVLVTVQEDWQRLLIVHGLTKVSIIRWYGSRLDEPAMIGGRYGGVLPKELLVELNQSRHRAAARRFAGAADEGR